MQKGMSAAVFERIGRIATKEISFPEKIGDDEALLKVEAASICRTDVQILTDLPRFPAGNKTKLTTFLCLAKETE